MPVEIKPGNLRDLSFIAANIRPEDWAEIACQLPPDTQPISLAWMVAQGESWTAHYRGQPIAAFGVSPMTASVLALWAWGTKALPRAAGAIERFVLSDLVPKWLEAGITRVEARSIAGHATAHRWMLKHGAEMQPCPSWGRGGEDFVLFSWIRKDWVHVLENAEHQHERAQRPAA